MQGQRAVRGRGKGGSEGQGLWRAERESAGEEGMGLHTCPHNKELPEQLNSPINGSTPPPLHPPGSS